MISGLLSVLILIADIWAIVNVAKSRESTGTKAVWIPRTRQARTGMGSHSAGGVAAWDTTIRTGDSKMLVDREWGATTGVLPHVEPSSGRNVICSAPLRSSDPDHFFW